MRVQIEYTAQLAEAAGLPTEDLELADGATLADLCAAVAARHNERFSELFGPGDGSPHPWMLAAINDGATRDSGAVLRDGDQVSFFSPISGG